jgi:xylulokinase
MGFFLGIDLGTSYFKAGLFDEKGRLKGLGRQGVKKKTGNGTICELSIPLFWDTLRTCVEEAIQKADIDPGEILALSYSSQANSFVLLDSTDKPLTPLILWPDKRAEKTDLPIWKSCNKSEFLNKTGLGVELNFEFCIAKINWFQKNQPGIWERVNSILTISDYLTFELTGQRISDTSTASLTGLLDVTECQLWNKSLELFSLSPDLFSIPKRTGSFAGSLTKAGAKLIGLKQGAAYYLGALDHHCAAIGSGVPHNNNISESTGTVLACVSYSHSYSPEPNRFVAPGLTSGHYFQMAFDDNGASSLEWYQKKYAPGYSIPDLEEMAKKVSNGCDGLVAKPCAQKYHDLTGFENIKPSHSHGHFIRALLESTSVSLAGLVKAVKDPYSEAGIISTGGGAKSSLWVKIKADMLKTVFFIPECNETACMGAAMIGAKGLEEFGDWDELVESWVRFKEIIKPDSQY